MITSIYARFKGTDSLGYVKNTNYVLIGTGLTIRRYFDGAGKCKYDSVAAFLKNWDVLSSDEVTKDHILYGGITKLLQRERFGGYVPTHVVADYFDGLSSSTLSPKFKKGDIVKRKLADSKPVSVLAIRGIPEGTLIRISDGGVYYNAEGYEFAKFRMLTEAEAQKAGRVYVPGQETFELKQRLCRDLSSNPSDSFTHVYRRPDEKTERACVVHKADLTTDDLQAKLSEYDRLLEILNSADIKTVFEDTHIDWAKKTLTRFKDKL